MDRLLGIVVDVENLFMCVHKEEDTDTKQVYFYLFKLLRKCILQMSKPTVEGPLVRKQKCIPVLFYNGFKIQQRIRVENMFLISF